MIVLLNENVETCGYTYIKSGEFTSTTLYVEVEFGAPTISIRYNDVLARYMALRFGALKQAI